MSSGRELPRTEVEGHVRSVERAKSCQHAGVSPRDELWSGTAPRSCPVCGAGPGAGRVLLSEHVDETALDTFAFASRKVPELMHWRLVECGGCGVVFASPAPSPEAVAVAYRNAGFDSADEARYAATTYQALIRAIIPDLPHGPALDMGAGDGAFLSALAELGVEELVGVEPSRAALAHAPPQVRGLIREDVFRASDFEPGRFALVSCLQTIEHLPDPLVALRGAHTVLSEGGALFVVCHDRHASLNRLLGSRSPIFDIEHLQLFEPHSLRTLLECAGFSHIEIHSFSNRYPLRYWARLGPLGRRPKLRLIAALDRLRLGGLPVSLPVGNLAAVAWKRASA